MLAWISANWAMVLGAVYVIANEIVALAPNLKSNSLVQLLLNILKSAIPSSTPQLK